MTSVPTESAPTAAVSTVRLLPSAGFFFRVIDVTSADEAAAQVQLFLEATAPFAPVQMISGHVLALGARRALVYAAHRARYEADNWADEAAVLPDVLALALSGEPSTSIWTDGDGGRCLVERDPANGWIAGIRKALPADLRPELPQFSGAAAVFRDGVVELRCAPSGTGAPVLTRLTGSRLQAADVRESAVVTARWRAVRQAAWLKRTFFALLMLTVFLALAEIALFAAQRMGRRGGSDLDGLMSAASVWPEAAERLERAAQSQRGPLEALAALNQVRPADIKFSQVTAKGDHLEVRGQAPDGESLRRWTERLKQELPGAAAELSGAADRFTLTVRWAQKGATP